MGLQLDFTFIGYIILYCMSIPVKLGSMYIIVNVLFILD